MGLIETNKEKIVLAYNLRSAGHECLLEADKLLDEVLKDYENNRQKKSSGSKILKKNSNK